MKLKHRENRWVDFFSSAEAALNFRCYAVSKDVVGYTGCLDLSTFPFVLINTRGHYQEFCIYLSHPRIDPLVKREITGHGDGLVKSQLP